MVLYAAAVRMMFDDGGGAGAGLLNTSVKSEGGQSRAEEREEGGEAGAGEEPGQALDQDSIKIMADTINLPGLPEEAAREIAEEVTLHVWCAVL